VCVCVCVCKCTCVCVLKSNFYSLLMFWKCIVHSYAPQHTATHGHSASSIPQRAIHFQSALCISHKEPCVAVCCSVLRSLGLSFVLSCALSLSLSLSLYLSLTISLSFSLSLSLTERERKRERERERETDSARKRKINRQREKERTKCTFEI